MERPCRDCEPETSLPRREFLRTVTAGAAAAAAVGAGISPLLAADAAKPKSEPESLVKVLFESLKDEQKKVVCFDWDYTEPQRKLLRTRVSNNWHITKPVINSDFFTKDQQQLVRGIFEGLIQPEWHAKIDKQLKDDAGGFGNQQNIAIFGKPGEGKFEFVMTGRHMTLRCDGNSADHVAFGGPIFYGHAASGFNEKVGHPGNVFWHQALAANKVFEMLDGKQREKALGSTPTEEAVGFRGDKAIPGLAVADMSSDQKELVQQVLNTLIEPYRQSDRDEVVACLKKQGGLDKCHLTFCNDDDIGEDGIWDNWRLEGPSFVWYFRGSPHVHVWVNVSDSPDVALNA